MDYEEMVGLELLKYNSGCEPANRLKKLELDEQEKELASQLAVLQHSVAIKIFEKKDYKREVAFGTLEQKLKDLLIARHENILLSIKMLGWYLIKQES